MSTNQQRKKKKKPGFAGIPDPGVVWTHRSASSLDLAGKHVAVIGGTNGLGRAIARLAAERGAEVTVVGQTFRDEGVPRIAFVKADLSLMTEATRIGASLAADTLDVVLLTTGIIAAPRREVTEEGSNGTWRSATSADSSCSASSRHAWASELRPARTKATAIDRLVQESKQPLRLPSIEEVTQTAFDLDAQMARTRSRRGACSSGGTRAGSSGFGSAPMAPSRPGETCPWLSSRKARTRKCRGTEIRHRRISVPRAS